MQYTLITVASSCPSISQTPDGRFQVSLISNDPFELRHGKLCVENLRFGNVIQNYWLEYLGRLANIGPLDWHVLKYLQQHDSSSIADINAYLESVKDKIPKTKLPLTQEGKKGIRKRGNTILASLNCPAFVSIDAGTIALYIFGRRV